MTKTFCDCCGEQIDPSGKGNNPDQEGILKVKKDSEKSQWNGMDCAHISATLEYIGASRTRTVEKDDYHICLYCRLTALNALDKRPKSQQLV